MNEAVYRRQLVSQLEEQQTLSEPLRQAFLNISRLQFVPRHYIQQGQMLQWSQKETEVQVAYEDRALVTYLDARGMPSSSSSQPSIMAAMLEALHIQKGQRILEIGTGTGYNAALLASLVGVSGQVVTIDIHEQIIEEARQRFQTLAWPQVSVVCANGIDGYADAAPYDHIIVTGGSPVVPCSWLAQLKPGGKLVMNLLCSLSHGIVVVTKQAEQTASGAFLPMMNVAFLQLRQGDLQPVSPINLTRYEQQPILSEDIISRETFPVVEALYHSTFLFYLQWQLPSFVIRQKWGSPHACHPTVNYLLDRYAFNSLAYPVQQDMRLPCAITVRGCSHLWEQVQEIYRQWQLLQQPPLDAYQLEVFPYGQQVVLGSTRWKIDEQQRPSQKRPDSTSENNDEAR